MAVTLSVPRLALLLAANGWDAAGDRVESASTRLTDLDGNGAAPEIAGALAVWRTRWTSYLDTRATTAHAHSSTLVQVLDEVELADVEAAEEARSLVPWSFRDAAVEGAPGETQPEEPSPEPSPSPGPSPAPEPSDAPSGEEAQP